MNEAIVTTSWDDSHPLDFKLAELLQKYEVPATFYLAVDNRERENMSPLEINRLAQDFDIGGHTHHHSNLIALPLLEAQKEILEGKQRLEEISGRKLLSFSYPYGKYNNRIIKLVANAGFTIGRTTQLFCRNGKDPFRTGTTVCSSDLSFIAYIKHSLYSIDPCLFRFLMTNNLCFKKWSEIAIRTLDFIVRNGGIWHLWGHSWEIDYNNDWGRLEDVFRKVNKLPQHVKRMNNSEIANKYSEEKVFNIQT